LRMCVRTPVRTCLYVCVASTKPGRIEHVHTHTGTLAHLLAIQKRFPLPALLQAKRMCRSHEGGIDLQAAGTSVVSRLAVRLVEAW